jgi:hypothetical protein
MYFRFPLSLPYKEETCAGFLSTIKCLFEGSKPDKVVEL